MNWEKPKSSILLEKLERPQEKIHLVLDTDAANEIDDQYAITYAIKRSDRIKIEAIYAAPFFNSGSTGPLDGMEKSYDEIKRLVKILKREDLNSKIFKGSADYLKDADTPQPSDACDDLVKRAMALPEGELLYVAAIGAITNIASAILTEPKIAEKIALVWLGGHAHYWKHTREFNMIQDVAAARVIFDSGVPVVQIPCMGVTSHLLTTESELSTYMKGKSEIGTYLYEITRDHLGWKENEFCNSKVIWDISAIMWLVGPNGATVSHITPSPIVSYEGNYSFDNHRHPIKVVDQINRDIIFREFFEAIKD